MFLKSVFWNDLVSVQCSDVTGTETGLCLDLLEGERLFLVFSVLLHLS